MPQISIKYTPKAQTLHWYAFIFRWINALAQDTNKKKHSISRVLNYGFQFSEVTEQDWRTVRSDLCIVFIFYYTWSILYSPRFNNFAHQLKDRKVVAHSLVARKNEIVWIFYHCNVPKDSQLKLTHGSFHLECELKCSPKLRHSLISCPLLKMYVLWSVISLLTLWFSLSSAVACSTKPAVALHCSEE